MRSTSCLLLLSFLFSSFIFADLETIKSVVQEQISGKFKPVTPISQKYKFVHTDQVVPTCHLIIRILIDEKKGVKPAHTHWTLKSDHGFIIIDNEKKTSRIEKKHVLHIGLSQGCITINNEKLRAKFIGIKPIKNMIEYKKRPYNGFFSVSLYQNNLYLVNYLDLEEYTESVLPFEGRPDWPDEFNKAFSIVVRTYGLAKVLEERDQRVRQKIRLPYDIKNTNTHQIYKGHKPFAHLKKIVASTRNTVLAYNQRPILAMFDICCGSVIPAHLESINFSKAPYLARTYPCYYCQECPSYKWHTNYSLDELLEIFKADTKKIVRYRDFKVTQTDKAGLVTEVKIKGKNCWVSVSGKKIKSSLKKLKSKCFTIQRKGRQIIFSGNGYGHHAGLCQWGAYRMVKENWDYRNILKFYYPGVHFMKLKVKPHAGV